MLKMTRLLALLVTLLLPVSSLLAEQAAVSINEADAQSLAAGLKGVGLAKAEAIVEYRDKNGPFKSVDELSLVKGIGWKIVEANREKIVLTDSEGAHAGSTGAMADQASSPDKRSSH